VNIAWYLGPLGAMRQIPDPQDPMQVDPALLGGVKTSLGGVVTVDRVARSRIRSWPMTWPYLTEDDLVYLQLVADGLVPGPLRLIDPWCRNRLPQRVATGGSVSRSAVDFTQAGGSAPIWVALTDPPAGAPTRGAISWQRTTTAAGSLTTTNVVDRVPLILGEQIRASIWVRGATIQASAAVDAWDASNTSARTSGTATTLAATGWTQLSVTYTAAAGRISATPVIAVASGQAVSTLQATGWMISAADQPVAWTSIGGAPTVVPGELTNAYALFNNQRHSWSMTLRESLV
jgi:hypothetical protein